MDRVSIDTTLTTEDWVAYCTAAGHRMEPLAPSRLLLVLRWMPLLLLLGLIILVLFAQPLGVPRVGALWALIAVIVYSWIYSALFRVRSRPAKDGLFLGPVHAELSPEGMRMQRARYESFVEWSSAIEVTTTPTHVFVWLDRMTAHVLPVRDLGTFDVDILAQTIRSYIANASGAPPIAPGEAAPAEAAASGEPDVTTPMSAAATAAVTAPAPSMPSVAQECLQLLKLSFMGGADPRKLYGRDLTILLLGGVALALCVTLEYFSYDGTPEFAWWDVGGIPWFVCVGLVLAWLLARLTRPNLSYRRALLLVAWFAPLAAIAFGIGEIIGMPGAIMAWSILAVEAVLLFPGALSALTGRAQRLAFFGGATWIAATMYASNVLFLTSISFWYQPEPEIAGAPMPRADREQLRYEQPLRLERALAQLERGDGADGRVFFLGFAGYGDQRVFAGEIDLAAQKIDERYGTARRALRLVNDRRDVEKYPLASVPALRHALDGMAKVMNHDEDVLFLSLSSHGSESAQLSVQNDLGFAGNLNAGELAQMLRESGIRWKVIVISACHAGSFIEALEDEHTAVITAAAKEKTSFGCSDDRDLTYFGEAFYRDALPRAQTLRAAFEQASADIARREREEGISASLPQAFFGAAIEQKLAKIEASGTGNGLVGVRK